MFIAWLVLSVIVGVVAQLKNRSIFGWILLSLIISPLISVVLLLVLPMKQIVEKIEKKVEVKSATDIFRI
ncbi:hypothetical protein [Flyfo podovirus Tbat2_2]|nr:hypothetical protein [Flyfo podovirus Tbat2_2]